MPKKNRFRCSSCPISYALDIFGDKWTLLVIRDLVFSRKQYFREFLASSEKIASNILADRLKTLEASGIVSRRPDPANARKIIYELTEKGKDLIPALLELVRWGAKHDAKTGAPLQFIRRIEKDREGFIAELKLLSKGEGP
jgi:DNA-binding HxlR family transcriptional regulator